MAIENEIGANMEKPTRKRGRPLMLDAMKRAEICTFVMMGCSLRTAGSYVGCTGAAISALAKRDASFCRKLNRAIALRELIPRSHLHKASTRSWRASAALLDHSLRGRFARRFVEPGANVAVDMRRGVAEDFCGGKDSADKATGDSAARKSDKDKQRRDALVELLVRVMWAKLVSSTKRSE